MNRGRVDGHDSADALKFNLAVQSRMSIEGLRKDSDFTESSFIVPATPTNIIKDRNYVDR
jgi:hypothetical protein